MLFLVLFQTIPQFDIEHSSFAQMQFDDSLVQTKPDISLKQDNFDDDLSTKLNLNNIRGSVRRNEVQNPNAIPTKTSQLRTLQCKSLGTNIGGMFEFQGEKYYLKVPVNPDQSRSEVLATNLYALTDLNVLESSMVEIDSKTGCIAFDNFGHQWAVASKWVYDMETIDVPEMWTLPDVKRGLGMDAWLAHYDHVGNYCYDGSEECLNIKKRNGKAFRIDFGGVFEWKAKGDKKGDNPRWDIVFTGDSVAEWERYQERGHPFTDARPDGYLFASLTREEKIESLQVVADLTEEQIKSAVAKVFPEEERRNQLQEMLLSRRRILIAELKAVQEEQKDYALFCSIDTIQLDDGKPGLISQQQKLDTLKNHGWFKTLKKVGRPEALKDTLNRHGISKSGTLAKRLEDEVYTSPTVKKSIKKLQAEWC
jgi:hypothetical protein